MNLKSCTFVRLPWVLPGVLLLGFSVRGGGEQQGPPKAAPSPLLDSAKFPDSVNPAALEAQRDRLMAQDRQRRILADTQRLATVSAELQALSTQTSPSHFSLEMLRKAEEADKLAHELHKLLKQ